MTLPVAHKADHGYRGQSSLITLRGERESERVNERETEVGRYR